MKSFRCCLPVLFAALAFLACKNDPKTAVRTAPTTTAAGATAQKVAYMCPMDCEKGKTYDQPGACPVCKMDLQVASADQLRHAAEEIETAAKTTSLPATDPNKTLEEEVNALHDQTMKEMAEMERIGRQIKEDFKTVQGNAQRKTYIETIAKISRAGFDMMAWMRDYHAPTDLPAAEADRYLKREKANMIRIRAAIQQAMADGKKLAAPVN